MPPIDLGKPKRAENLYSNKEQEHEKTGLLMESHPESARPSHPLPPSSTHSSSRRPLIRIPSTSSIGSLNTFYSSRRFEEASFYQQSFRSGSTDDEDDQRSHASSSAASGMTRPRLNNSASWSLGSEEFTTDKSPKLPRRNSNQSLQSAVLVPERTKSADCIPAELSTHGSAPTLQKSPSTDIDEEFVDSGDEAELGPEPSVCPIRHDAASAVTCPSQVFQTLLRQKRNRRAATVSGLSSSSSMASVSMGTKSHNSFSSPVQSLLESASKVLNCPSLDEATQLYNTTMKSAGAQIVRLNNSKKMLQKSEKDSYHRELRAIGTIMGLLRTRMALVHCVQDDFEDSIKFCDGAIQVHSYQPTMKDINGAKLDEVDELSGLILLILERLKKAKQAVERHFKLLQRIDALSVTEGDASMSGLSAFDSIPSDTTPKEIVFEIIEQSVRAEDESTVGFYDEEMLEVLSVQAVENDKQDEAIKFLRDAIQIHLVALGLKHRSLGKNLIRIAKMYRGNGNDRENEKLVLGYFHQTAAVLKRSSLGNRERGSILNDIAVIHMRRLDFEEAIKFLLDALHAFDEDAEEIQKAGRTAASMQVWRNLGECYMILKKFRSAEGAFLKALDIQDQARRLQDTAESLDLDVLGIDQSLVKLVSDSSIANTICRIGRARAEGGDLQRALDLYKQALNVIHRGNSEDEYLSDEELLMKRDQLTEIFLLIANACSAVGEIDKAFAAYRTSLRLRTANGADTLDTRRSTTIHCLKCYSGISDLYHKLNECDTAITQLKEALDYADNSKIQKDHPVIMSLRQKLKSAEQTLALAPDRISQITKLERQADAEIENGTLDKATETLRELLGIRRAMLKNMKDRGLETADQIYSIACLLQTFGFVFAKNGDDLNAEIAFKDASLLFKRTGKTESTFLSL